MVNYDPENDMIKQLQRARDVIASTLYSNKKSGLKIDKKLLKESAENADTNHNTSDNSNKNKTLLYLSKKPWSVLAKELDIQKKRIEAKLVDIEKDNTYQYTNLKTKDEQLKYVTQILCLNEEDGNLNGDNATKTHNDYDKNGAEQVNNNSESVLKLLENPWKIFNQLSFSDDDRYKLLIKQFDTLPKTYIDKFYEKLWALCLRREEKVPDEKVSNAKDEMVNKNVSKIDEEKNVQIRRDTPRTYEIPTKAERHAKKLMPWELLNGELPQLRQMDEEDESNYEFVNLELLKPLINGILKNNTTDEENINIHVERRAVVYHIMKNIKAGEGGLYETALLQNIELRKRLKAATDRIGYLEKENENIFRTAEERIEKNAAMMDSVLRRNKEKLLEAQTEAEQAKVRALNLTETLKSTQAELETTKTKLQQSLKQQEKQVKELRFAKKQNDEISFELKTKFYETNKQPSLWELTSLKKQ